MGEAEKPVGRHDHSKAFEKPNGSLLHIKAELIQSENNKGRTDEYDFKHEMLLAPGHQTDDISFLGTNAKNHFKTSQVSKLTFALVFLFETGFETYWVSKSVLDQKGVH